MAALSIRPAGDAGVLVDLGARIDPAVNARVHTVARQIGEALRHFREVEIIPSYTTVLVRYDPFALDHDTVVAVVREVAGAEVAESRPQRRFVLPVVYGGEFGPDLDDVAREHGLSSKEVVDLHANRDYPIYALGFSPGFPFLGGLDERIHTPRLETPRSRVPAGSVGIGGEQTGVYPTPTPGGWRLIGRTPLLLFDVEQSPPVPYRPGDVLRFQPIDSGEYERLLASPSMPQPVDVQEE